MYTQDASELTKIFRRLVFRPVDRRPISEGKAREGDELLAPRCFYSLAEGTCAECFVSFWEGLSWPWTLV